MLLLIKLKTITIQEGKAVNKLLQLSVMIALSVLLITSATFAQDYRWMDVSYLVMSLDRQGAFWMSSPSSTGQWPAHYKRPWQEWKAPGTDQDLGYHGVDRDNVGHFDHGGKTLVGQEAWWYGVKNWESPPAGKWGPDGIEGYYTPGHFDIFLYDNGPITLNGLIDTPVLERPIYKRKVDMPVIKVDGATQQPEAFNPASNIYEVDPSIVSDGFIESKWTSPIGLTFNNKMYGWSNPEYANMVICELTITNTGDCNAMIEGIEKPNQTLEDLWIGCAHNLAGVDNWVSYGSYGYYDGTMDWFLEYDPEKRYYWTWDGDAHDIPGDDQFDPRGGPQGTADLPTGEYCTPEVAGIAFLHIDKSGTDESDDPGKPATFRYVRYQDHLSPVLDQKIVESWNWMTGEDGEPMYMKGFSDNPYAEQAEGMPHWDPIFGIGPYTLGPGEDIKIVYCYAIGSVDEARAIELGYKVKNEGYDPMLAKKEIYETGRDRLFAEFERAKDVYFNKKLQVPTPPAPPTNIEIVSGPELVKIKWDPVDGAAKYRIYRAVGGVDYGRVYKMVAETSETNFTDEPLTRGFSYYYYVNSVDANGLESSHYFTRINKAAVPFRRGLETADWADKVRVVPNPFNIKGNTYKDDAPHNATGFNYDGGLREQNTVTFVNLPEYCTIRIYNSVGDLIKTLNHTSGSADERWWPIITDDNQYPASGVYFYTIEVTDGPLAGQVGTGKLVIIR